MQKQLVIDQLGRNVLVPERPLRIVSLVPSQTELLFDLGLERQIAGITKFCIHPAEKVKGVTKIGGTKKLDLERIRSLQPDLIIGNKEENEKSQIDELMQEFPVWMSDIYTIDDALWMIGQLGHITGKEQQAADVARRITESFANMAPARPGEKLRVAYLIWKNPYMIAASHTFINDVIERAGWQNAFSLSRYPQISAADLQNASPDLILLSSEPYPFKEKHLEEFKAICPRARVMIADGELFSWYGSRLLQTPAYLQSLVNQADSILL